MSAKPKGNMGGIQPIGEEIDNQLHMLNSIHSAQKYTLSQLKSPAALVHLVLLDVTPSEMVD